MSVHELLTAYTLCSAVSRCSDIRVQQTQFCQAGDPHSGHRLFSIMYDRLWLRSSCSSLIKKLWLDACDAVRKSLTLLHQLPGLSMSGTPVHPDILPCCFGNASLRLSPQSPPCFLESRSAQGLSLTPVLESGSQLNSGTHAGSLQLENMYLTLDTFARLEQCAGC